MFCFSAFAPVSERASQRGKACHDFNDVSMFQPQVREWEMGIQFFAGATTADLRPNTFLCDLACTRSDHSASERFGDFTLALLKATLL